MVTCTHSRCGHMERREPVRPWGAIHSHVPPTPTKKWATPAGHLTSLGLGEQMGTELTRRVRGTDS